jgi:hypothetical protein
MRIPRAALGAALLSLALAPCLRAQDSHYWTNQYGTRATLLGGTVIGSVLDLSGTYYNPGGLILLENPETLMAAKVFQYPVVTLVGGDLEFVPLHQRDPGPAPSLVAGTIRIRAARNHWLGYSYVSRQEVRLGLSVSSTGRRDILPEVPGAEDYATQFRLDEKLTERWLGLTWSTKVADGIGFGVSQYFAIRTHRTSVQEVAEALTGEGHTGMALDSRQYQYRQVRAIWKIGLACDFNAVTLGLTLTTPSLSLIGFGSTGLNSTLAALDVDGDGEADDHLAADFSNHLRATYRSPLSLAAGMTVKFRKVRLYTSLEWFAGQSPFTVLDSEEFTAQSTGETLSTDVRHEAAPVLNWGVGWEWSYSSRFKGYASFTTDYSAKRPGTETNLSLTDWNIYHVVTGAEFAIKTWQLTAGLGFSFGARGVGWRPEAFEQAGLVDLWDPFADLRFRYANYKAIIGFAF